ncbi:MAG: hypothetical protein JWP29_686 [Rhodoferax sp.]|nr:hypothetical protein [Rhodoferax sp.]
MFAIPFKKLSTRVAGLAAVVACLAFAVPAQATITLTPLDGPVLENFKQVDDNGVLTTIWTFCLQQHERPLKDTEEFTLTTDGVAYFGAEKSESIGELFTAFDAYNGDTDITHYEEVSLGWALWNITDGAVLQPTTYFDNSLVTYLLDARDPAHNDYQVGAYMSPAYQDYLWLSKVDDSNHVPEPGSLALVGLALGGIGVMRRRKPGDAGINATV